MKRLATRSAWWHQGSEPKHAREALALIGALFAIEREIATAPRLHREAVRWEQSGPLVARFFAWCDGLVEQVLDDTPLAAAIGYARNQRQALQFRAGSTISRRRPSSGLDGKSSPRHRNAFRVELIA